MYEITFYILTQTCKFNFSIQNETQLNLSL